MTFAPEMPETRLAASNLAAQAGNHGEAVRHLRDALDVAPTFALAHEFFGRLLLEVGRFDEGLHHLLLAVELDPALSYCLAEVARYYALIGDLDGFHKYAGKLVERLEFHRPSIGMVHLRVGAWTDDEDLVRKGLHYLGGAGPRVMGLRRFGELLLEPPADNAITIQYVRSMATANSPRLRTLVEQIIAEAFAFHGQFEQAFEHLERASSHGLVDMLWLEHCPLFAQMRDDARYLAVWAEVEARCDAVRSALA